MSYRIREVEATEENIDTLKALHQLTFFGDAPQPEFENGYWWLAYYDKEPIGFAGITPSVLGFNCGYLKRSGVLRTHRGQGLQRKLIRVREARAKRNGWTRIITDTTDNPASANNLYAAGYKMFTPKHCWALPTSLYWTKTIH